MVVPSYELLRVARRLQSGRPLSITIIGQSNTARNGGCYCDGPSCEHQRGWAHLLGTWIDNKWPHPEHTIHNSGNGGDAADRATRCLDTYLSANTDCQRVVSGRCQVGVGLAANASALQKRPPDVIIADFAVSGWNLAAQERLVRKALESPSRPLVVLLGLTWWCCTRNATHCKKEMGCLGALSDPIGDDATRLAAHYGQAAISMVRVLAPEMAMAAGNASSKIARSWPIFDGMGVHGRVKATGPYYTSIAHALFQFFSTALDAKTKAPPLLHRSLLRPPEVPAPLAPPVGGFSLKFLKMLKI